MSRCLVIVHTLAVFACANVGVVAQQEQSDEVTLTLENGEDEYIDNGPLELECGAWVSLLMDGYQFEVHRMPFGLGERFFDPDFMCNEEDVFVYVEDYIFAAFECNDEECDQGETCEGEIVSFPDYEATYVPGPMPMFQFTSEHSRCFVDITSHPEVRCTECSHQP